MGTPSAAWDSLTLRGVGIEGGLCPPSMRGSQGGRRGCAIPPSPTNFHRPRAAGRSPLDNMACVLAWVGRSPMPTPARLHVAHALHEVFGEGGRVPDIWDRDLGEDAHLAQALLGLCLRRWGRLQAWVKPKLKDPERGVPLGTRVALGMGLDRK